MIGQQRARQGDAGYVNISYACSLSGHFAYFEGSRPNASLERAMATLKSKIGAFVIPGLPINRRTFDILRYELLALGTRALNVVNPSHREKICELRKRKDLSVNVGSGGKGLPGWVNIELHRHHDTTLQLDIRHPLPLADNSVARILAEHVVEHIDFRQDIPRVLSDWHRILRPDGVLRIIVPDIKRMIEAYVSGDKARWLELGWDLEAMPGDIHTPMHILNHTFNQDSEHLFAYDFETLALVLRRAGFETIERMSYRRSRDPQLAIDQQYHAPYSLYVEAVKQ